MTVLSFAWLIAILWFAGSWVLYPLWNKKTLCGKDSHLTFACILLFLFLFHLLLAAHTDGHPSDMACWAAWGDRMNRVGAAAFYSPDYFCDYPPGYLYVLGILSRFAAVLHLPDSGYLFLLKLPAVFADFLIAVIVYRYANKHCSDSSACLLAAFFFLAPPFLYNSSVWGQIESVLLLFLILAVISLTDGRMACGIFWYVLAVLIKPQALLLAPIVLLCLLSCRSLRVILRAVLVGIMTFFVLIIPYSPAWQEETGLSLFLSLWNPTWIIEKYLTTMTSYPYFTVNAFNLYALLGLNWTPLDTLSSFGTTLLQSSVLTAAILGSYYIWKKTAANVRFWLSGYFLFGFLFTFALKMHERYLLVALAFLFFAFLASGNKKLLMLFSAFCGVSFCNLYEVLRMTHKLYGVSDYRMVFPIALAEVLLFIFSILIILSDFLHINLKLPKFDRIVLRRFRRFSVKTPLATSHMTRLDTILLSVITLVYAATAFFNLGDMTAPQTYYQPQSTEESFTLVAESTETIAEIDYYCGIGDVETEPGLRMEYSPDGENWYTYDGSVCSLKTVFYWEVQPLDTEIRAKYLRFTPESADYMLFEVGFRNTEGNLVSFSSTHAVIDEQSTVTNAPTFRDSTYFDEIYHPRTAYEHLHLMTYYETTHPPLGKLIMSVGIAIFGMTPFGWRFAGTLCGVLMLPLFYYFLKQLFGRTRYAVIGTLLFAFDFMHFSLTRLATIDSYPVLFIIGMYCFMYRFACIMRKETPNRKSALLSLFLSGLCMGLGCASKWTAVYAAIGLAAEFAVILILRCRRYRENICSLLWLLPWCLLFFVLIPAGIYLLSYLPISLVDGYGNVFSVMLENQSYMFRYHSSLQGTHPYSSPWYTWPFVYKPMWAYQAPETSIPDGTIGCISIFQNPLLSWVGLIAMGYSIYIGFRKKDERILFLMIGFLAQYLPWALVSRYALQYHFFASMVFLVLFAVYAMYDLESRYRRFSSVSSFFTILCLLLFLLFYPVLSGTPISRFWAESVLTWFDSWVFFI